MNTRKIAVTIEIEVPSFLKDGQASSLADRFAKEVERQAKRMLEMQNIWAPWRGQVLSNVCVGLAVEGFRYSSAQPKKPHLNKSRKDTREQPKTALANALSGARKVADFPSAPVPVANPAMPPMSAALANAAGLH